MTGERRARNVVSAQPGGRAPAPGQLALVQAFINSHYSLEDDHGAECWASPASLRRWLRGRGLISSDARVGAPELHRALAAREALRALAARDRAPGVREHVLGDLNAACAGAAVELRFDDAGARFALGSGGTFVDALGLILGITAGSMIDGGWPRMKICPGAHCGWAFYDASRNGTGRWCSMSVCGGRAKARAHYRRRQAVP
jgi:predicted RNA-binding Zn ribbon-like protein